MAEVGDEVRLLDYGKGDRNAIGLVVAVNHKKKVVYITNNISPYNGTFIRKAVSSDKVVVEKPRLR